MSNAADSQQKSTSSDFAQEAAKPNPGIVAEFGEFLMTNKKWWLTPIVLMLMIVAGLIFLSGTVAAPFIYSLF